MTARKRMQRARAPEAVDAPVELTLEEIEAKARGGRAAANVTRKIRASRRSTKSTGKLRSDAPRPIAISRSELASIGRRKGLTKALRERLPSSEEAATPPKHQKEKYARPTRRVGDDS